MNRKLVINGLFIALAILLVAGMAYQFTPAVSALRNASRYQGTPALTVNGTVITTEELDNLRRSSQVLSRADTGVLGDDFKIYTVARAVQQKLVANAARDIKVSRADVNAEVDKVRQANNLTDNKAWSDALQGIGLTDAAYRAQVRESLAIQRKADEIKKAVPVATEAEAQAYYDLNPQAFQTDARIVGREMVLNDEKKAKELLSQIKGGADFAKLASENSVDATTKKRGGALGPIENGQPKPVAGVALPGAVSTAALSLTNGGVTDVVSNGGKFYIVKVEKYLPPTTKPFADAKSDATTAVTEQKKNAALEQWVDSLLSSAKVEYKDITWKAEDPTVATVAGQNIRYSEVLEQVVNNQQLGPLLDQLPPEQVSQLVNGMLKPQVTTQLIQGYAAPQIAKKLKLDLVGTRQEIASSLSAYGARDVKVTEADIQAYYTQNKKQFETPAKATVSEVTFKDRNQALAFRADWKGSGTLTQAASKAGGTVSERGTVTAGDGTLGEDMNAAVFNARSLRTAGDGSFTDVVKSGEKYLLGYVTDLQPAATQPLNAVRSQIEAQLQSSKRNLAGQQFMAQQVASLKPVNNLDKILAAQEKRVAAAEPKTEAPKTDSGGGDKTTPTPADPAKK